MTLNLQNLKVPTSEQARKNGSKGGKKSQKVQAENRDIKRRGHLILTMIFEGKQADQIRKLFDLEGKPLTVFEVAFLSCMIQCIKKGNAAELERLMRMSGVSFNDTVEIKTEASSKFSDILAQLEKGSE